MTSPEIHSEAGIPTDVLTMPEVLALVHSASNRPSFSLERKIIFPRKPRCGGGGQT